MKKIALVVALTVALSSLTACMGTRGTHGGQRVCENDTFLGISIIEVFSPCGK